MPAGVAGIYKEGKIELLERPTGIQEGPVRVILLQDRPGTSEPKYLHWGKYKDCGRMSTEDDFKIAEWHGEDESNAG